MKNFRLRYTSFTVHRGKKERRKGGREKEGRKKGENKSEEEHERIIIKKSDTLCTYPLKEMDWFWAAIISRDSCPTLNPPTLYILYLPTYMQSWGHSECPVDCILK